MKLRLQHYFRLAALLIGLLVAARPALAGDDRIRIPAPPLPPLPRIVLPAPPPMIWLPGPQVYVARNSPHRIFFHDGHYYLFHQDAWYLGPGYAGPWAPVRVKQVPPGLRRFHGQDWDGYQREAEHRYREGREDDEHHAFFAGREEGERHERARWRDDDDHDRGWRGRKGKRETHGRGRDRDDD